MNEDNMQGFELRAYSEQPIFVEKPCVATISQIVPLWWRLIPGKVEKERRAFDERIDATLREIYEEEVEMGLWDDFETLDEEK